MSSWADITLAFFGGALSEVTCLLCITASERKRAVVAALWSMAYALTVRVGFGEALHTVEGTVALVCGFGFGTWAKTRFS